MNGEGEIVGMVDVLKLTYATLEQINTMSNGDGEGPAWNKFWLSIDHDTESLASGDGSRSHHHTNLGSRIMSPEASRDRPGDSVAPGDSASHAGAESPPPSAVLETPEPMNVADLPFPFKFKAPTGRVHRLQVVASHGMETFVAAVAGKMGNEAEVVGGIPAVEEGRIRGSGFALSYIDGEGDTVSITTDNDLLEAVILARQGRRDKVDLFVHDPEKPPVVAPPVETAAPETPSVSAASRLRDRRRKRDAKEGGSETVDGDEEEDEDEDDEPALRRSRKTRSVALTQEQLIAGVPNDLLLPGAIAALAVVIVSVFTIARVTSR